MSFGVEHNLSTMSPPRIAGFFVGPLRPFILCHLRLFIPVICVRARTPRRSRELTQFYSPKVTQSRNTIRSKHSELSRSSKRCDASVPMSKGIVGGKSEDSVKERKYFEWEERANLEGVDNKGDRGVRNFDWRAPRCGSSLYGCIMTGSPRSLILITFGGGGADA